MHNWRSPSIGHTSCSFVDERRTSTMSCFKSCVATIALILGLAHSTAGEVRTPAPPSVIDATAEQSYALTASAVTITAGAALSITWSAPSGRPASDWIALYKIGDANTGYIWWQYTAGATSGTASLTAPAQAGSYEFRYLLDNGYADAARSAAITVSSGTTYTLTPSATIIAPGGTLSVSWTAPGGRPAADWVALYKIGDPNTRYIWWQYTAGATSGTATLTAPAQAGSYEFRYLLDNGYA